MERIASFRFIISILWVGFLLAISFMEAPLKFQPELVTLPIGLSIGRIIFSALNKVEWVLLGLILIGETLTHFKYRTTRWSIFLLAIICIQSFWLLPILDNRAALVIQGNLLDPSKIHFYYLAFEVAKLAALVLYSRQAIKVLDPTAFKPQVP